MSDRIIDLYETEIPRMKYKSEFGYEQKSKGHYGDFFIMHFENITDSNGNHFKDAFAKKSFGLKSLYLTRGAVIEFEAVLKFQTIVFQKPDGKTVSRITGFEFSKVKNIIT